MPRRRSIELAPKLEKVREASETMVAAVAAVSSDPNLLFRINVGLTEALTNSIIHGCKDRSGLVSLTYQPEADTHVFRIHDPGYGPQQVLDTPPKLDDDLLSDHHRGQVMIHWAADAVRYYVDQDGFELTLVFRSRAE